MLNLLNLIKLKNLGNPSITVDKAAFRANLENLLTQSIEVNRNVVGTGEDIGKQAVQGKSSVFIEQTKLTL
jgi:hypothetical protein